MFILVRIQLIQQYNYMSLHYSLSYTYSKNVHKFTVSRCFPLMKAQTIIIIIIIVIVAVIIIIIIIIGSVNAATFTLHTVLEVSWLQKEIKIT